MSFLEPNEPGFSRGFPPLAGFAIIALVGLAFVVAVPPIGEFPCSDDWDYKETVRELVDHGLLRLSDYPAMTLVGHVAWGALFAKALGTSYFALRCSVLLMTLLGAWSLYSVAYRLGADWRHACLAGVAFIVSPLTVASAYTFLTDATGVGVMLIWLAIAMVTVRRDSIVVCFLLGLLGGLVYLFRQPVAVPVVALIVVLFFEVMTNKRPPWSAGSLTIAFAVGVVAYSIWLRFDQQVPINATKPLLAEGRSLLHRFDHICSMFGTLALFALPVTISSLNLRMNRFRTATVLLSLGLLLLLFARPQPFVVFDGETLEDLLLGYDRQMPGRHLLVGPAIDLLGRQVPLLHAIKFAGLVIAIPAMVFAVARGWQSMPYCAFGRTILLSIVLHSMLISLVHDTYDRYLLPLLPFVLILACLPSGRGMFLAIILWSAMTLYSAVGIQDYMVRNRAFWAELVRLQSEGVNPIRILAGHAYAGVYRFTPIYRPDPKRNPRPVRASSWAIYASRIQVVDPEFPPEIVVSVAPLEGFETVRATPYRSWMRQGAIYVLKRVE